jgi:hypothetical protein
MRATLPLWLGCAAALAACTSQPNRVSSTPPSVSYRVSSNNVADTNDEAQNYCAQYGRAAQYRGVENAANGAVAVYTCDGTQTGALSEAPAAPAGSTVPPATVGAPRVIAPAPTQ